MRKNIYSILGKNNTFKVQKSGALQKLSKHH